MNTSQILNLFFFALGIASCMFVIFSVSIRIIRREINNIREDFLKELREGRLSGANR